MVRLILGKLVRLVVVLFLVSVATFWLIALTPGDPAAAILGESGTPAQYAAIHKQLGLDRPIVTRYFEWFGGVLHGDFGQAIVPPVTSVGSQLENRLPVTLQITVMAMIMALLIAIPLGVVSAYNEGGWIDRAMNRATFAALSVPSFLAALLLIYFFVFHTDVLSAIAAIAAVGVSAWLIFRARTWASQYEGAGPRRRVYAFVAVGVALVLVVGLLAVTSWSALPRAGYVSLTSDQGVWDSLRSTFLPALALAITEAAIFTPLLRTDMISTLREDYITSAKASGVPMARVLFSDALRPSSFSLFTVAGISLGRLIGGTVVVETIFGLPGLGTLLVQNIEDKDYPVVEGATLVIAALYVVINAIVDIMYSVLDPRIRRA